MLSLKHVLVPIDFSERSVKAAEHAAVFADRFGSDLLFLHAIPPAPMEYAAFEGGAYTGAVWPSAREIEANVRQQMDALIENIVAERPVKTLIAHGDPAQQIVSLAKEHHAGMVIMPTHGFGPFRRFVLGSVTTKVLHDLKCPVFTGAHISEVTSFNREPYKRIACAVDLKEHSEEVLRWAWEFAQLCENDLIVIHAAPQVEVGASYGDWFPPESRSALVEAARNGVHDLVQKVGCANAEIHVDSADPVTYVSSVADESYADILVIGRSLEKGVLGRLRTQAFALIREAPCPVISV